MSYQKNVPANPIPKGGALTNGLTKREIFAMHALQGILANADGKAIDSIVREAVMFADMTLERLYDTNK